MQGVTLGSRADFEAMLRACTLARLRPVLDERRFAFEEAPGAFARMKAGEHLGKIVIEFSIVPPCQRRETERRRLYVACTRAREHLLLTGVSPVSEYLVDLGT